MEKQLALFEMEENNDLNIWPGLPKEKKNRNYLCSDSG